MNKQLPPAQLWIGPSDILGQEIIQYLQTQFCQNNDCATCSICLGIRQHQYHAMMMLQPEKQYTLKELDPLFHTLSFALDENQKFFFIIDKAEWLSAACSNKLLKSIEEPPPGYHFIFLTQRADDILPTIHSRCIERNFFQGSHSLTHHELYRFFTHSNSDPNSFLQNLGTSKITERESIELLDALIEYWTKKYTSTAAQEDHAIKQQAEQVVDTLTSYLEKTPMPGSSKIFWRDLYLAITTAIC